MPANRGLPRRHGLSLVTLMLTVHEHAAPDRKPVAAVAVAAVSATATLTVTVHFLELSLTRHGQLGENADLAWMFAFSWPSVLYGVEIVAWNFFFGTAVLCASVTFPGRGRERAVRIGLLAAGGLTLAGLIGPVVGHAEWRVVGLLGYGAVFPVVCLLIGSVLLRAAEASADPHQLDARL